ncbi:hypothetical protein PSPO01_13781 [Paraphaeosphaeria sporulosa]
MRRLPRGIAPSQGLSDLAIFLSATNAPTILGCANFEISPSLQKPRPFLTSSKCSVPLHGMMKINLVEHRFVESSNT